MRVFIDANIFLDRFDSSRRFHKSSILAYGYLIYNAKLFTSCDIITTLYYIGVKVNKNDILKNIQAISKTLKIIEFSNKEVEETCQLMLEDNRFVDLEDTIQYIMAKKQQCDLMLSNDATFKSRDIRVISSEEFCLENKIELE